MQPMRVLQHEQLPPQAHQLAATYQMGIPQEEFKVAATWRRIVGGTIMLIAGLVFAVFSIAAFTDTSNETSGAYIVFIPFALLFGIWGLFYLLYPVIYRSWRVYACAGGLIYVHGSKIDIFPWDSIQALWERVVNYYNYSLYSRSTIKYTIQRDDGFKAVFTQRFAHVRSLSERINHELMNRLYPRIVTNYNAGNTINFGPLSVNTQGISNGRNMLPWVQVADVTMQRGYLNIRKPEGTWRNWASIRVASVPNVALCMALVGYAKQGQAIR
ncbi:MAG TPA: DUF6585 family protein [Ktedonobacteraceae bacterium]|jgi:hypothetical protein|nr:DUF6585 family protein [Ktedonobacteraceae bacterium]